MSDRIRGGGRHRFWTLVWQDVRFEVRHGMYTVYAVVCALYVLVLLSLSPAVREVAAPLLVFSDPAALGFFFVGGMVLLERKQDVLTGLFVTPLDPAEYVAAKATSLALLSVLAAYAIMLPLYGWAFNWYFLTAGVFFSSVLLTLVSIPFAMRAETLNEYFLTAGASMAVVIPPVVEYFLESRNLLFYLFPTQASLVLIAGALEPVSPALLLYSHLYLIASIGAAWWWARREVTRVVHRQTGGSTWRPA
ncbi:fluoroquinolone export ABC transporter permease subunit [Limnochorda pilosa]|uniref:Uncharacterized protein n=1 Tax=Limnochorda pilosa TaxID=1555112 RepID=A0A0K2SI58_LIMPI|nr:hypothetical protein [Limnochorda pilosa]BAS26788.1 hypothetical protein LIP_0931 [Limnochorda pilosa]